MAESQNEKIKSEVEERQTQMDGINAEVESSDEKKVEKAEICVNELTKELTNLRKALNKKQIQLAAQRLESFYRSDEDITIIQAVTSARGFAKFHTVKEQNEVEQLQIKLDVAQMQHEEYFGRFRFNAELAEVERKNIEEKF